jgi:beta-ureidopropionase / N-carbamoyl-L-amino-acid hydrolase
MALTLHQINTAPIADAATLLDGLYEHSPWIAQAALAQRPFASAATLKYAMTQVVQQAGREAQVALVRAHPELAGKAMASNTLTAESTNEQNKAGLTQCTPQELAQIQKLNAAYRAKFGFPFVLAVRGPRGAGLAKREILATFERRLRNPPDFELAEALRNIHRIVEIRLNDKLGYQPLLGHDVWDWQEDLSQFSDPGFAELGQLTVTYLTPAHRACAAQITDKMQACGFDSVKTDAVGNVVARYESSSYLSSKYGGNGTVLSPSDAPSLLTGSHYDTVRNAGKYDGRLGIFVPMACVRELVRQGRRLPFALEVVAFAEEEGQRYKATFLGSGALIGAFNPAWLDQTDADGIAMRDAMAQAGLKVEDIHAIQRNPAHYLGFVEVHIEQGPVLNELNIPLGIVTSINGSMRYACEVIGMASHAGTTPMDRRRDAAAAVAELSMYLEKRAAQDGDSVGTIGIWTVPNGSTNVVPGRCQFTLDLRAPTNAQRDALVADVLGQLQAICERRNLQSRVEETMRAAAAPSSPAWQQRWEDAARALGVPIYRMPSGAGHDAMKLHEVMPQAMLFVRGQNAGISHNPLESTTSDDMQLAIDAFMHLLDNIKI